MKRILVTMLYVFLIAICRSQLIYSNFYGFFTSTAFDWNLYSTHSHGITLTTCELKNLVILNECTGYNYNTLITKTFELQLHNLIILSFEFQQQLSRINSYNNGYTFYIYIDNQIIRVIETSQFGRTNSCSSIGSYRVLNIYENIPHQSTSIQITMVSSSGNWGISEFQLKSVCQNCIQQNQKLIYQSLHKKQFSIVAQEDGWTTNGVVSLGIFQCTDFNYLKSTGNNLIKDFVLNDHQKISFNLKVLVFNLKPTLIEIKIDNQIVQKKQVFQLQQIIIIKTHMQLLIRYYAILSQSQQIQVITQVNGSSSWFGIRDFQLFIQSREYLCEDSNIQPFDGCFSNQYDCNIGCSSCIKGQCLECSDGWIFETLNSCIPICGDQKLVLNEVCDDGNNVPYDGCHHCQFSCPQNCFFCQFGICLEYFQTEILIEINNIFDFNGLTQYKQTFQEKNFNQYIINFLEFGYYDSLISSLNYSKLAIFYQKCDQHEYELLEQKQFHKHSKILNCQKQLLNKCISCDLFFQLSFNEQKCIPLCGDGITILDQICDDKNNIQFDGCYKCEKSCQLECLSCIESKCYTCQDGWALLDDRCYEKCGDGQLAITSSEQCDDGNYQPNDGCYNCQFECDQNCFSCATVDICFRCLNYFEVQNGKCQPICGDLQVVPGLEECEDGNQIPYDGCFNCQLSCDQNCKKEKCEEGGKCIQCQSGFYIINDGQRCEVFQKQQKWNYEEEDQQQIIIPKCGDQIRESEEQCDDGNLNNFDGCSEKCLIEEGWNCDEKKSSICYKYPVIKLLYLNVTQDKQYVQLSFSRQVRWNGTKQNFSDTINFAIQGLQDNEFDVIIIPVVAIQKDLSNNPIYEFEIKFINSVKTQPIFEIFINDLIVDEYDYPLLENKKQISLKIPKTLSDSQLAVANSFQTIGNFIMIGLVCSSGLMFLLGDLSSSFEIFDALQFQSYLRFINVEFPDNLQIYFSSSDFLTVQPVLINFKIIDVFDILIGQKYLASIGKLSLYELNADLLTNIYGIIAQIALFIFLYFVILIYRKFFYSKCFTSKHIYYTRLSNSKIIEYLVIKFYILNQNFLSLEQQMDSHNYFSKQLGFNFQSDHVFGLRYLVSNCVSIGYLGLICFFFCQHFKRQNQKIVLQNLRMEQHEGVILMKKLTFIIVLIGMQKEQIYQCIVLTLILFSYIFLLNMIKFTSSNLDLLVIVWMEAPVMLFTLISLIYCTEFKQLLNQNQRTLVAFIQIGLLVLALFGPILKAGVLFYEKIKNYIKERQKLKPPIILNVNNIFMV